MVVIVEGMDNTGKDTMINYLCSFYKDYKVVHCSKPEGKSPEEQSVYQDIFFDNLTDSISDDDIYNTDKLLIFNRAWQGEYVYGCLYRGRSKKSVINMFNTVEECIKDKPIYLITMVSSDMDLLVKNDDGLSISEADKSKMEKEFEYFKSAHQISNIKNKLLLYVNNGSEFHSLSSLQETVKKFIGI